LQPPGGRQPESGIAMPAIYIFSVAGHVVYRRSVSIVHRSKHIPLSEGNHP
jgi:hypothetical protein